jgi:hypothetical protein
MFSAIGFAKIVPHAENWDFLTGYFPAQNCRFLRIFQMK